jgi:hypothetical protein
MILHFNQRPRADYYILRTKQCPTTHGEAAAMALHMDDAGSAYGEHLAEGSQGGEANSEAEL